MRFSMVCLKVSLKEMPLKNTESSKEGIIYNFIETFNIC